MDMNAWRISAPWSIGAGLAAQIIRGAVSTLGQRPRTGPLVRIAARLDSSATLATVISSAV
jgi:hypothetical protein